MAAGATVGFSTRVFESVFVCVFNENVGAEYCFAVVFKSVCSVNKNKVLINPLEGSF